MDNPFWGKFREIVLLCLLFVYIFQLFVYIFCFQVIFKCNKCETMWNSAEVLHYHLYSEHQVGDAVCDVCGTILKNIHYVKRHIDHVHRRVKNFQCDKCKFTDFS